MDWFPICMGAFGIAFILFLFLKIHQQIDDLRLY